MPRAEWGEKVSGERGCCTCSLNGAAVGLLLKVRVQLLAAQKPIKRQIGGKESLLYFGYRQPGVGEGRADSCPKADSLQLTISGQELL